MSSVDDRIVNMKFNNQQFKTGASESQKSLESLEKTLSKTAQNKGLENMAKSVETVKTRFSAMQVAGVAAVATIASKATLAAGNLIKSFTINPLQQGFAEYQTNLNSIQTILANTGKKLPVVQAALNNLNRYSDQTVYNFAQMAQNIGRFTAAGVEIKDATSAIKGLANTAALSGANTEQLNSAMYQMSQALSTGVIKLMDWNSLSNANMAGTNVQEALKSTAQSMGASGDAMEAAIAKHGNFRNSLTEGWLTADVFNKAMTVMAGKTDEATGKTVAFSVAQLKAKGYTEAQAIELNRLSQASIDSATKIKTLPQLMDVVRESIGSLWGQTFTGILGNFNQSKRLWTRTGEAVTGMVSRLNNGLNGPDGLITQWGKAGRIDVIHGVRRGFRALVDILAVVRQAFADVFPPASGNALANMSENFAKFMKLLLPSESVLKSLRSIFGGVFAVLHIGYTVVKALTGVFTSFFGEVFKGSGGATGGILSFAAGIGELLMKLDKFLTSGGKMVDVFKGVGKAAGTLVGEGIEMATNIIEGLVSGLGGQALSLVKDALLSLANLIPETIKNALGIHSPATEMIPIGENIIQGIIEGIKNAIVWVFEAMGEINTAVIKGFGEVFGGMDALDFAAFMNAIFTGALILTIRNFVKNTGGLRAAIAQTFGQLTDTLKTMQNAVKAKTILSIAIAVGVLAAAIVGLSFIPAEDLAKGLGAVAIVVGLLVGAMAMVSKIDAKTKIAVISTTFVVMATSILILSGALAVLSAIPMENLAKGVAAVAALLTLMMGIMAGISKFTGSATVAAGAMISMAFAITLLAGALAILAVIPFKNLMQGVAAIAILMGVMMGVMVGISKMTRAAPVAAGAMIAMAFAIDLLVVSVTALGLLPFDVLKKGLIAVGILLLGLVVAMAAMSAAGPASAIAAAGMVLIATAIGMLVPLLILLGNLDWGTILKGIGALALIMVVAAAGLLLIGAAATVVAPGLLVLAQAFALVGLGMLAFGTGFAILAAAGVAGIAVLAAGFQAFLMLLPTFAIQLASAFVTFIETIAAAAPRLRRAFSRIFEEIIGVVQDAIPVLANLLSALIAAGISVLQNSIPRWIEMGWTIIDEFLKSVDEHIPSIVHSATSLITKFMDEIGKSAGPLADSAFEMIIDFLNGISTAINENAPLLRQAGLDMALAIANGLSGGLLSEGWTLVKNAAEDLADALPGWMKKVLGIKSPSTEGEYIGRMVGAGLARGVARSSSSVLATVINLVNSLIAAGNSAVKTALDNASMMQARADRIQAKAEATARAAELLEKKNPKLAKKLQAKADKQQSSADSAQSQADDAAQAASNLQTYNESTAVEQGNLKTDEAKDLAAKARVALADANAYAAAADKIQKKNAKKAKQLRDEADKYSKQAKAFADQAAAAEVLARDAYGRSLNERIKAFEDARKAEAEQEVFDKADNKTKADILAKRAEAAQAKADSAEAAAQSYFDQAKAVAATDVTRALALLDLADEQAAIAKQAADDAKAAKEQAEQLAQQGSTTGTSSTITPSRTVLEDAASAVDRYSASLAQAEELAAASEKVVQFVQNNNSPEALTASEIYRQTKNLLTTQEVKMEVTTP